MPPAQTEKEKTAGEPGESIEPPDGAPDRVGPAARYGLAAAAVVLAAGVKWVVDPALEAESPFLLFVVAIAVGAWLGGLGPGLFATGLALVVCDYLFLTPLYSFGVDGPGHLLDLLLFGGVGGGISALVASMHAARLRSATSERRFRLLVQGAKDYAILMLSPDGRVTSWNEGARRILGYEEAEILGEHFSAFLRRKTAGRAGRSASCGAPSKARPSPRRPGRCARTGAGSGQTAPWRP